MSDSHAESFVSVPELFTIQAAKTPDAIALLAQNESITFADADAMSDQVGIRILEAGVQAGSRVGVLMYPSPEMIVVLLGIMKAGCAYVPLDPHWPIRRVNTVLKSVCPALVMHDKHSSVDGIMVPSELRRESADVSRATQTRFVPRVVGENHLFNVVYTSGTTGDPNGVLLSAMSLYARLTWLWRHYPFVDGDTALVFRSACTTSFCLECFGPLLKGACLVTLEAHEARNCGAAIRCAVERRITHLGTVPSVWDAILDYAQARPEQWSALRYATTGSEHLPAELIRRWRAIFPRATLLNVYGATECPRTAVFNVSEQDPQVSTRSPVGKPVSNVEVHILDDQLLPVCAGEIGEIYVGGAHLAHGYLNQPALTAAKFVAHPFSDRPGAVLYRTGDLGRWRSDGNLELLGRTDFVVKIRGFRVDVGEIETTLQRHPSIKTAVVLAERQVSGDSDLVAYLVTRDGEPSLRTLRSFLQEYLPDHMVPRQFWILENLPNTVTGKVDRALVKTANGRELVNEGMTTPPRDAREATVVGIWQAVLGVQRVGIDDDFFEVGGDSLRAMQVIASVRDEMGIDIPFWLLFEQPTIRELSQQTHGFSKAQSFGEVTLR